jgi:hypothetical protein
LIIYYLLRFLICIETSCYFLLFYESP